MSVFRASATRAMLVSWPLIASVSVLGCAPALTQVRDDHPARAGAPSAPLPEVATTLSSDAVRAAPGEPMDGGGHHHHHHGGGR